MIFKAYADGVLDMGDRRVRCALGRNGVVDADAKIEGDGCSPAGMWPMRRLLFRPDRINPGHWRLPSSPLGPTDGWCDAPHDRSYNRQVDLPYPSSVEQLWRDDHLYDLIVVLGHNDDPPAPGAGSAIFLHLAAPGYSATEGCVALAQVDLEHLLSRAVPGDAIEITLEQGKVQP